LEVDLVDGFLGIKGVGLSLRKGFMGDADANRGSSSSFLLGGVLVYSPLSLIFSSPLSSLRNESFLF
jgi:hypothetical protein